MGVVKRGQAMRADFSAGWYRSGYTSPLARVRARPDRSRLQPRSGMRVVFCTGCGSKRIGENRTLLAVELRAALVQSSTKGAHIFVGSPFLGNRVRRVDGLDSSRISPPPTHPASSRTRQNVDGRENLAVSTAGAANHHMTEGHETRRVVFRGDPGASVSVVSLRAGLPLGTLGGTIGLVGRDRGSNNDVSLQYVA